MYKHTTTHRTLSRRLAALLAAMALLAALALPVYAEALDGATQMQETVETDNNGETDNKVETGSDVEPDDKSKTNEGTGAGADTDSEDTKDNALPNTTGDSNTTADDAANDTPQTLPDDNIDTTAGKTTTNDTLDTMDEDEDAKQDIVTRSADDAENAGDTSIQPVDEATSNGITYPIMVYFAVPEDFNDSWWVRFNAQKGTTNSWVTKPMTLKSPEYQERRVFGVELTESECKEGTFGRIQFQFYEANTHKGEYETSPSTSVATIANKLYDAKEKKWVEGYKPFDPTDHTAFKEKTMAFKNAAATDLKNVVAHFYEKTDGTLADAGTCDLDTVTVGATVTFNIPAAACSYVQFTADNKEISSLYNFYGQEVGTGEESFLFDETNCFCFVYTEKASNWTRGGDGRTIFYDATFSKLSLDTANAIPSIVGGDVYYYLTGPNKTALFGKMTKQSDDLYYIDGVDEDYDHIIFAARKTGDNGIKPDNLARSGESTANLEIPSADQYAFPCFYADTGDDSTYNYNEKNQRGGYWAEVNTLRDAETGKSTSDNKKDVVAINKEGTFVADPATKYISTTLYDYYTDYELNGNSRTDYSVNEGPSHRNWVTFREFDQAISDYYKSYDEKEANVNKIRYPIYTGHFQPSVDKWGTFFTEIGDKLNLYGFSSDTNSDKYKAFRAANNSAGDEDGSDQGKYDFAFQGIVADTLSEQGDLLMNSGTKKAPAATTLVEPHFNESFLSGENSKNAKLGEVYHNVSFPFTKKQIFSDEPGVDYWWYDSSKTSLYLREDTSKKQLYLGNDKNSSKNNSGETANYVDGKSKNLDSSGRAYGEGNTDVKTEYGFFPFNESLNQDCVASKYNYGYGAKLEIPFSITSDGKVESSTTENGEKKRVPIRYYFSGDDDVWVFIDNKLVLDIGGAHGKVSGILDFSQTDNQKNTVTAYVSQVKKNKYVDKGYGLSEENKDEKTEITYTIQPNDNNINSVNKDPTIYYQKNSVEIENLTTGTHTLTMFYMERGMWESNMAVAFNFPDYNELQVQKIVDDRNVNELFAGCFDNQRFFNFTIRNQATHYGTNDAKGDTVTTINLLEPGKSTPDKKDFTTTATHAPGTSGENRFIKVNRSPDNPDATADTPLLNWYTQFEDLTPSPGSNKEKRYGILTLDKPIDISGMSYLSFDVYVDSKAGDAALSNMYLQLRDSSDKKKGCLGQTFIGGKDLYGQVEMHNNRWITVKLSLDDVKADEGFDKKRVKELRFGCNYPRSIYLRNIVFSSKAVPQTVTGFTTKQEDIADYGSAQKGELMPAVNAQYTSDAEKGTMVVDKNGGFVLQNKETVTFKDQFRRGSYLSINEQVDTNLFDTHWTICEDGKAVTSTTAGEGKKLTLEGTSKDLENQPGTAPDDGRIENKDAEGDGTQNAYDGQKPSAKDDNTIVFRSYAKPDATDADGETQLKVVFVNTVKTGSLTIKKEQDGKGEKLTGKTYKFMVRFTNVGGHALEDEAIVVPYEVTVDEPCVINNIPVGTRFTIEEVTPTDGSKLTHASVTGGGSGTMVLSNNTVRGSIVEGAAGKGNQAVATFTNTKQDLLDITGTKVWEDANGTPVTSNLPDIYVQLQRRHKDDSEWEAVEYRDNEPYQKITDSYDGMTFSFLGLPAKDYDDSGNQTPYEYRVVEGSVDNKGVFQAVDDEKTITIGEKVYSVTYEYTDPEPDATNTNNAKQTMTITNTQQDPKFTLDITKADAENTKTLLPGVEFTLERLTTDSTGKLVVDGNFNKLTGMTNEHGVLMLKNLDGNETQGFKELEAGTYRLTETKAAKDYNLLSEPITIIFSKDGKCKVGDDNPMQANENEIFTGNAADGYKLALTVLNRKTPALPHTGADAPSLWLLIGLPLAVAGLLILVFRYNKKGGRTR